MKNPFENALIQLARANEIQKFPDALIKRLRIPEREIIVAIPVVMDDGSTRIFKGYRVQHSSIRGPYKGGLRFHPDADIHEVSALAFWMTMKTAVAGIPLGGGKGGVVVDPRTLSKGELERLSRGFVQRLAPIIGPKVDVPAPDVNTTPEIMSWMNDEYMKITGDTTRATFTGKPIADGGSEGRTLATAQGGFYAFEALRAQAGLPEKVTVAVQGMGNVGGNAAMLFAKAGHTVVAISDSKGGIYKKDGLNVAEVEEYKAAHGSLVGFPDAGQITNDELLLLDADVLIPAALENQITDSNAGALKVKFVLELANGPTTPEADDILFSRGIMVVPDIFANAGGVTVSYFEWQQNIAGEHWSEKEVNVKLHEMVMKEAKHIIGTATKYNTDLRRAAFIIALERLNNEQ